MNVSKFKKWIAYNGCKLKPTTVDKLEWEDYYQLAELTRFFDFGCKFTERGCRTNTYTKREYNYFIKKYSGAKAAFIRERMKWNSRITSTVMCCCRGCLNNIGWSYYLTDNEETLKKMAKYFSDRTGYWRPNKGCILPRKYRSRTCLSYACCLAGGIRPANAWRYVSYYLRCPKSTILDHHYKEFGERYSTISEVVQSLKTMIHMERR